ncbi:hypothetical protein [Desertihabitans brevis]|uniref:hypothetical protein n=1 Tax=Desertihabitans brevis TaxID=2268447 RepID=UPI001314CCA9|nr:hypothetical protein [Desertihabitans brevis]
MTDPDATDEATPTSRHPELDAALDAVADLGSVPLAEHHERLERAHRALHELLSGRAEH